MAVFVWGLTDKMMFIFDVNQLVNREKVSQVNMSSLPVCMKATSQLAHS